MSTDDLLDEQHTRYLETYVLVPLEQLRVELEQVTMENHPAFGSFG